MAGQLAGKVALVTGGSRGLGAAIVRRLARDGAAVAFTFSSAAAKADAVVAEIEGSGGRALALRADSADAPAVRGAVAATVKAFGRLDILVNNAGIALMAPIEDFAAADFERLLAVNVKGVFYATQAAVRHMGHGGRVIMIGSINSDRVPFSGGSVYALSKGALAAFTHGLARDLGPRGITVNNIQPGPVDTEMNPSTGPFSELMRSHLAVGRYGEGEDVAAMVSYLAGPEAGYVTGASLRIDGGFGA